MSECNERMYAKAIIKGSERYPDIHGEVSFCQKKDSVFIQAAVYDLPMNDSGFYGFHIHEGTSCGNNLSNTGSHLNPENNKHPLHEGDLPPLLSCSGNSYMTVRSDRFTVGSIIGRTVVIHLDPDDFRTQPSGESGEKIACGIIK